MNITFRGLCFVNSVPMAARFGVNVNDQGIWGKLPEYRVLARRNLKQGGMAVQHEKFEVNYIHSIR